jgi:hypothetical protein
LERQLRGPETVGIHRQGGCGWQCRGGDLGGGADGTEASNIRALRLEALRMMGRVVEGGMKVPVDAAWKETCDA